MTPWLLTGIALTTPPAIDAVRPPNLRIATFALG